MIERLYFGKAIGIEAFYRVSKLIEDPASSDRTLVALGAKFSGLKLNDMKLVVQQTRFYKTPELALGLFASEKFQKETMPAVVAFSLSHGICDKKPTVSFEADSSQLIFDNQFLIGLRDGIEASEVK